MSTSNEVILFIDEIHTLVGAGGVVVDGAAHLKTCTSRGELRTIGATTLTSINDILKRCTRETFSKSRLMNLLKSVVAISCGLRERYENHHKVRILDEALIAAAEMSKRYVSDRALPDKAIDLMDEAAAKLRLELDSMPEKLDEMERKRRQLEIEREAIKRDGTKKRLSEINKQITEITEELGSLKGGWESEKELINIIQSCKEKEYRIEADEARRVVTMQK